MMRKASLLIGFVAFAGCKEEPKKDALQVAPVTPASAPASQPARAGSQPAGAPHGGPELVNGDPISGKVTLDSSLPPESVKPSDTLFIMVRQAINGQAAGLMATKRITPVTLPVEFAIGQDDTMMKGTPFVGPFIVHTRLDRDGDPMTKTADDLFGVYKTPVSNGQKSVDLVLGKGTPETQPGAPPSMPQPPTGNQPPSSQPAR